jgi:hypothetical protein
MTADGGLDDGRPMIICWNLEYKRIKGFGFTLNEVAGLLDMIEVKQATCNNIGGFIDKKVDLLDKKIRELIH